MASSWRKQQAPVLDLGRPSGARFAAGKRRSLLWPVWVWDVVAPDGRGRRLDVLERAALGYAELGIVDTARIASRLGLERELLAKVWASLRGRALIGGDDRPTRTGRAALEEARVARSQLVSGVVAVDAFEGLPVAIQLGEPRFLACEWSGGTPILPTGTEGRPGEPIRFSVVDCAEELRARPSARDIVRLAADASSRRRNPRESETLADAELSRFAEQVSVGENCRQAFVWIELAAEELMPEALTVRLPRPTPRLVRSFLEVVKRVGREHEGLQRKVVELLGDEAADHAATGLTDSNVMRRAAEGRVLSRMGERLAGYAEPFEQLVALERKARALEVLSDPRRDSIEDVVTAAQKSVEAACEVLRLLVPNPNRAWPWERSFRPRYQSLHERLSGNARVVGFAFPPWESPAGRRLASVNPGTLFSVFAHGGGSLLPKTLCLVVYGATEGSFLPIREAARLEPDLLSLLVELDRYRNPSSHGGRREDDVVPTVEDALRLQRIAERAVTALLNLPPVSPPEGDIDG